MRFNASESSSNLQLRRRAPALHAARLGSSVLEVTTTRQAGSPPAGKNDDFDAQNAAHAALAGQRTVTPRSRDGMIESLRVLMACRKTAVSARRIALQMIHNTIVCAPDALRDQLRNLTRMQLVRTVGLLAAGSDSVSAIWIPPIASASNRSADVASSCMTRLRISM